MLDAAFGPEFIIVVATPAHQRQGIDRFFVHRRDGRLIYRVDYKCDARAGTTGNLALEHVSVVRRGQRDVLGWLHTTIADLIVSYVLALDTAFVLEVASLRVAWPDGAPVPGAMPTSTCRMTTMDAAIGGFTSLNARRLR